MDAGRTLAELVEPLCGGLAVAVAAGAWVVLLVKVVWQHRRPSRNAVDSQQRELEEAVATLRRHGYREAQVLWLFANGRHERTIVCQKIGA